MKKTLLTAFVVCLLAGCQDDDSQPADNNTDPVAIEFWEIATGDTSGTPLNAGNFVINSVDEWTGLQTQYWQLNDIITNFQEYTYIFVLDEQHPNGGHRTEVVSIVEYDNSLTVDVENYNPADDEPVLAFPCQPYHIVKIDKTTVPVTFE